MAKSRIGLAGIGKLGRAMMNHWYRQEVSLGIFHPEQQKVKSFINDYPNGYQVKAISELDIVLLALPADAIIPFLHHHKNTETLFINMATSLMTEDIKNAFPDVHLAGLKFMGHATDLQEHGNGLFISEQTLPDSLIGLFQKVGSIENDNEEVVINVNKLATYHAVKAAVEIEEQFEKKGLPAKYKERAWRSLAPEVIRSYSEGKLGHFGQEVVKEVKGE
ncbi:NAD(P)-binding domain-containing protein [Thalassobacillus sp. B23F22_16]|uniref:NAD(P)-binding domain-containing protein n=1 Tax=Thalassobacillus sp. B23F22_16 TaxID=3459513 RepID=UPI00373E2A1C